MNPEAFAIALKAFTKRRPFKPFMIELVSGDRLLVGHPEAITIRGELLYFADPQNRAHLFQCESVCQLRDVPVESST